MLSIFGTGSAASGRDIVIQSASFSTMRSDLKPMDRQQLLKQLDKRWTAFKESYAGLSDSQMTLPGVTGNWSVKDIVAHVTWWEEEALKHLPLIITGGRPPR